MGVTLVSCVPCTCHKYQSNGSLVNKCVIGDLLETDLNKVWVEGVVEQKVIPRPLADYFVVGRRQK
jgi:hypothetical protein